SRADVRVEKIGKQEDLAIRDGNHVGWNVSGDVASLCFDERQRSQRAAALLLIQLRRALKQSAVKIEHVARIRLASRWTAKQQRNFAIRSRVLREVVVNDQCMAAVVAEKLADRAARIGRDILHGRRVGSGCSDNDG